MHILYFPFNPSCKYLRYSVFTVCVMRLTVQRLLHFVVSGFFFKAITVTSVKSLGHSPTSYLLLIAVPAFKKISEKCVEVL